MFDAALVDVTQVGEPPLVLARQRIAPAGPLPYELRIPYRQALIQPRGRYEVHAAVTQQGRLLLDTPGVHPVLLSPAFRHVDVILARRPLQEATLNASVPLRQTYWKLIELVDGADLAAPADGADAAHLVLARDSDRAMGSGGCNRFAARYQVDGGSCASMPWCRACACACRAAPASWPTSSGWMRCVLTGSRAAAWSCAIGPASPCCASWPRNAASRRQTTTSRRCSPRDAALVRR